MSIIFDGRFPTADIGLWTAVHCSDPDSASGNFRTAHIWPNGNALSFSTAGRRRASGYYARLKVGGTPQSERLEFLKSPEGPFINAEGLDAWFAWSVRLIAPDACPKITTLQLYSKFQASICPAGKGASDLYMAAATLTPGVPADRWNYRVFGGNNACSYSTGTMPGMGVITGQWIDFVAHYKFSKLAANATSRLEWRFGGAPWAVGYDLPGKPNLVAKTPYNGDLNIRHGCYKLGAAPDVLLDVSGLVVTTTRAEAEAYAFQ